MYSHKEIITLSREIGIDPAWVLAGGGNSSEKDGSLLYVKASGTRLADITTEDLVAIDRDALSTIWDREFPTEPVAREEAVAKELLEVRAPDTVDRKPSVETFIHALLPQRYVMHTHASLVNGIACARDGEKSAQEILGPGVLWIPSTNPGVALALEIRRELAAYRKSQGSEPDCVIMQNHGLVVAGETTDAIREEHKTILKKIGAVLRTAPAADTIERDSDRLRPVAEATARALADLRAAGGSALERPEVTAFNDADIQHYSGSAERAATILQAPTPDHLMYSGHRVCYVPRVIEDGHPHGLAVDILHAVTEYCHEEESVPRIVLVEGVGAVAIGEDHRRMEDALALFRDTIRIARYAENFGGIVALPEEQAAFVRRWKH